MLSSALLIYAIQLVINSLWTFFFFNLKWFLFSCSSTLFSFIKSSKLLIFDGSVSKNELDRIKKYYINAIESREKDLSVLEYNDKATPKQVKTIDGFVKVTDKEL
mgnify:CR=1 FL=1